MLRKLDEASIQANLREIVKTIRAGGISVVLVGVPKPALITGTAEFYAEIAKEFDLPYEGKIVDRRALPARAEIRHDPSQCPGLSQDGRGHRRAAAQGGRDLSAGAARLTPVRLTLLMCVAEALSMTGFATYTTLLPVLQREWGLSQFRSGLDQRHLLPGYVAATPILTSLTDRVDARRVYLLACGLSVRRRGGIRAVRRQPVERAFLPVPDRRGPRRQLHARPQDAGRPARGQVQRARSASYTASFGIGSTYFDPGQRLDRRGCSAGNGPSRSARRARWWPRCSSISSCRAGARARARQPAPALLDFRPVLRNRKTLLYILGYSAHNYELFGQRSWMVAFLVFYGIVATRRRADADRGGDACRRRSICSDR